MSSKSTAVLLASVLLIGSIGASAVVGFAVPVDVAVAATQPTSTAAANATPTEATNPTSGPASTTALASPSETTVSTPRSGVGTDRSARAGNASLGAEISGFLRVTTVEIDGNVDSGMWVVAFERAPNLTAKQRVLDRRTAVLDDRLERIQDRGDELFADEENRSLVRRVQRAELVGELRVLRRTAIPEAKTTATSAGVNAGEIKELGAEASNVTLPPTVATLDQ